MLDLKKIIQYALPDNQYHKEVFPKSQIVIHHTASGPSAEGVINYWKSNSDAIATAFTIDGDGDIYQSFSSTYYAAHLGIPAQKIQALGFTDFKTRCASLHKASVGIEVCNWGGLTKDAKGRWVSYAGVVIPADQVQLYPEGFRGYKAFQKYTLNQIAALKDLLIYLCSKFTIGSKYNTNMFDISKAAIGGENGIWTHCSYRSASDKQDCHPQPELLTMLTSL
jgi:N-acetyl-anhydromuramyl-L-alanine amidase AmpD